MEKSFLIMEQENLSKSSYCDKLVSINTIADGNCLIHAILKACYDEYQNNSDVDFRRDISKDYRRRLSEYILEPNPMYKSENDVSEMIKMSYKTASPRNFLDFLRTMYNYTNSSVQYPYEPLSYEEMIRYSIEGVRKYNNDYRTYLNDIKESINSKNKNNKIIRAPYIEKHYNVSDEADNSKSSEIESISKELFKSYNEFEGFIDSYVEQIRSFLEYVMGVDLYLPTSFNKSVIETIFERVKDMSDESIKEVKNHIPKGIYSEYKFNSNLFTVSEGAPLVKFEYEYNEVDDIVRLSDISAHLNSRKFIGDADGMLYVPHILNINLIVLDFENCSVITIYENTNSDYYVIVNNIGNIHFETVGVMNNSGYIETLFRENHPLIQECLKKESRLNLTCLENQISLEEKIRKTFTDRLEKFRLLEQENRYAYIVLKEFKTVYRFYINISGDVVDGYATERIKYKIKSLI